MELIASLIVVPVVAALLLLAIKNDRARDMVAIAFAALIALLSIAFAVVFAGPGTYEFAPPAEWGHPLSLANLAIDLTVAIFVVCYAVRYKRPFALGLAALQIVVALWFEFAVQAGAEFSTTMRVDALGVIMVLIIGIVGSGICVYALGYMKDFQAHELHENPQARDRRPWFFAIMFAFLSAMFNIVLVDNMAWMYTAWEVTTLCSFLLIGFTKSEEAINNAFRQIVMNLLGGVAFRSPWYIWVFSACLFPSRCSSSSGSAFPAPWSCCPSLCSRLRASRKPRRCPFIRGCSARWSPRRRHRLCCIPPQWSRRACSCL